ncbi:type II toxin-antitoxin system RelE/ParE family toxin [Granulosicoccus antarcticus]|uniref:Toxin HigB-1 n=1 Tax=Granulosicoccus antarcticus IMCC3135 TaxID=1192854 RepID=A0A2Z2NZP2_9GAMM|nr:type II toxin-antitoxin system RelE/ParE family toxin [Granulosicoccus antarcticus]ASJ76749.1 Toxin HigB-1 [Granulosicoccus antarcticus IMCC3135]
MIRSFKDKKTARFFEGEDVKDFRSFVDQLARRLTYLNEVEELLDLRELRSNRIEALVGKRKGQYSIRINKQWRLCFRWGPDGPEDVEVVDYH